ncbi:MAG: acetyl-CoA C-acyltransferase [Corynebacterium urealyticum]|uniref:Probable acetyl-CoA acetyltransferase n=1 Tax=Corynebacterium urealyticum TaxID=43771 RepID=A0A2W5B004_9CORY|nr:MAG: acetyl-CoA C-acyltransferase [Corynebacterium urealyticum]
MPLNPQPQDVVIVGAARTPQGRLLGALSRKTAVDLGAATISAVLERSGVGTEPVDYVLMGQVVQAAAGQNPAKQAAVAAGLGMHVPAMTINKVCLSGLDAVISAARMIKAGDATVVVAGGQESMSNAPHLAAGVRAGKGFGGLKLDDALARDGLTDPVQGSLNREEQDHIAALSHQRAERAIAEGTFDDELVPIEVATRKETITVSQDEGVRPGTTEEGLAKLRPAFRKEGTITAGSSSQISDGAAAVVLTTRENAEANGWNILATVGAAGQTAGPDTSLLSQPSQAVKAALSKAGWETRDLEFLEINEAFGAVVAQSLKDLDYPLEKTNIHGGGISLGHPIGCSGARVLVTAAHELNRRGSGKAAVSLCGGGGQGDALLIWK